MLKKFMASLGVGAAKVNLQLDRDDWRIGETMRGRIVVEGGSVDQEIHHLAVDIVLKFNIKGKDFTKIIDTVEIARDFQVRAREIQEIPFGYEIPVHFPISRGSVSYHLATRMDIARAVDTGDKDKLRVLPGREMALIMDALMTLGFKEKIGSGKIERLGQEFDFYPTTLFSGEIRELELKFYKEAQDFKLFIELELAGGFRHFRGKHYVELSLPPELMAGGSVRQAADYLEKALEIELGDVSTHGPRSIPYHDHHHHAHRPGFGGFIGGMAAGLLGAAVLGSLFDEGTGEDGGEPGEADMAGEGEAGGGFDFNFGGFDDEI